jgi:hypothetical protein
LKNIVEIAYQINSAGKRKYFYEQIMKILSVNNSNNSKTSACKEQAKK